MLSCTGASHMKSQIIILALHQTQAILINEPFTLRHIKLPSSITTLKIATTIGLKAPWFDYNSAHLFVSIVSINPSFTRTLISATWKEKGQQRHICVQKRQNNYFMIASTTAVNSTSFHMGRIRLRSRLWLQVDLPASEVKEEDTSTMQATDIGADSVD